MAEKGKTISGNRLVIILFLIALANIYSVFQRSALAVISNDLLVEFGMNSSQLGTLASCFLYSYALMQIVSGLLTAKYSAKHLIGFSLLLSAIITFAFTYAGNVWQLMIIRVLAGIGCSFIYVPALRILNRILPEKWVPTAIGCFISAGHMGSMLASTPLKLVCLQFGWRKVFFVIAILVLAVCVLLYILMPDMSPNDSHHNSGTGGLGQLLSNFKYMLIPGVLVMINWSWMSGGSRQAFQSMWAAQFFENAVGLPAVSMSNHLIFISLGSAIGGPLFGILSNKIGVMKSVALSTTILGIIWFLLVPVSLNSVFLTRIVLMLMGASGSGGFATAFAAIKYFDIPSAAGLYTGMVNSINFVGSGLISQITGRVVDASQGSPIELYRHIFIAYGLLCFVSVVLILIVNKEAVRSRE